MQALEQEREAVEAASRVRSIERWLAVSEPLPVDDDPSWDEQLNDDWRFEHAA